MYNVTKTGNASETFIRKIFCIFVLSSILIISASAQGRQPKKPNIVLIFMDDMGYGDLDSYGGIDYVTPNLDKLASQGMRFTNFYAAQPICTVSRAGILTGCYPNRIGLSMVLVPHSKIGLNPDEETIASMLKKNGYVTGMVGKWHLGDARKFLPLQHGFDEYFGLPYSNDMWPMKDGGIPDSTSKTPLLPLIEGNKTVRYITSLKDQSMLTTWYTEKAVSFIKRHKKEPFFFYFAHSMVHVPLGVSDKFKGKSKQGLFGDVMMEIDWSVGEVMKALKDNGLEKNTLVVFTSDNGPWLIYGNHAGSAGGLREGKFNTFEGGQREPAIMRWPGVIPDGTICNKLACAIDLLPTFAAISGSQLPSKKIDGINIFSLLKGESDANPRDHLFYYYHKNDLEAVRQGNWKLVFPHRYVSVEGEVPGKDGYAGKYHLAPTGLALYDLRRDPGERYDVKDQFPQIVERLQKLAEEAREDMGDDLTNRPGKNRRPAGKIEDNERAIWPNESQ
ncbi:MAG TPA: sulfatase [Chitinophagaceae bacterium]|nr:sulfatase [Chitinophagaceae bacterium]